MSSFVRNLYIHYRAKNIEGKIHDGWLVIEKVPPIIDSRQILQIKAFIENHQKVKDVVICSWQRMEEGVMIETPVGAIGPAIEEKADQEKVTDDAASSES